MPWDGVFEAPFQEIRHGRGAEAHPSAMSWGGPVESITVTRSMLNALRTKHPELAEKAKKLSQVRLGDWQKELRLRNLMND